MTSAGFISDLLINGLGTALLHSVWQGLVIVLLLRMVLYLVPKSNVQLKYWLSVTALTGLLFWTGYTFNQSVFVVNDSPASAIGEVTNVSSQLSPMTLNKISGLEVVRSFFNQQVSVLMPFMDTLVLVWLLGVIFFMLRLQGSILYLRRIKSTGSQSVPLIWQQKAVRLSQRLGLRTPVKLLESRLAEVPMVIGHIKPVILLPVGMLTGLTVSEVEAILAHELAHIKRYDYLINIVQTVIESLLFFNPAVWWISQIIRKHREHCCDDIAVKCCGNQLVYASALSNLGAWSLRSPSLGMGLFKTKNELLMRIKRLVYPQIGNQTIKDKLVPGIILILTVVCLSWYSHRVQAQLKPAQAPKDPAMILSQEEVPVPDIKIDTIPQVEEVEALPPMEPVPDEFDEPVDFDFMVEVDTAFPGFDALEFEDFMVLPPDFNGFTYMPEVFKDFDGVVVPDVFVNPDIWVDVKSFIDTDQLEDVLGHVHMQLDDTTRERIMKALEEQRQALEQAMKEQEEVLEKARQQLRESLESDRPDELTEEEWEMAKERIEQAERSLERAMERSSRELERALEGQEYDIHVNMDRHRGDMDRKRIELRHVHQDRQHIQRNIARAHANADRFHYQWDTGNEAKLRQSLLKDGLIDDYNSDISLTFNKFGIKVNGVKLDGEVKKKYREMLDEMYGNGSTGSLSFSR